MQPSLKTLAHRVKQIRPIYYPLRTIIRAYWRVRDWQVGAKRRQLEKRLEKKREHVLSSIVEHEKPLLLQARQAYEDQYLEENDPLISVCILTWNRADLLVERAVTSALSQTYQNFEIVIIGDHCTDNTQERLTSIGDPRIRFINLPERGPYPQNRRHRHMVAGTYSANLALSVAQGKWFASLDDDDEWLPNHLEKTLRFAQEHNLEFVWGQGRIEVEPGKWIVMGARGFEKCEIPHSSVMFRSYLRLFKPHIDAWKIELGGDWHQFRRMNMAGVRGDFLDEVQYIARLRPGATQPWVNAEDLE